MTPSTFSTNLVFHLPLNSFSFLQKWVCRDTEWLEERLRMEWRMEETSFLSKNWRHDSTTMRRAIIWKYERADISPENEKNRFAEVNSDFWRLRMKLLNEVASPASFLLLSPDEIVAIPGAARAPEKVWRELEENGYPSSGICFFCSRRHG